MTVQEFNQLEDLLGKLSLEIGEGRIFVNVGFLQDGYQIGVYNNGGNLTKSGGWTSIRGAVERLSPVAPPKRKSDIRDYIND